MGYDNIIKKYRAILIAVTAVIGIAVLAGNAIGQGLNIEKVEKTEEGRLILHGNVVRQAIGQEVKEYVRNDGTTRVVTNYFRIDTYEDGWCYTNRGIPKPQQVFVQPQQNLKPQSEFAKEIEALKAERLKAKSGVQVVSAPVAVQPERIITDLSKRRIKIKLKELGVWEQCKAAMKRTRIADDDAETIWDEWSDSTTLEKDNALVLAAIDYLKQLGLTDAQLKELITFSEVK